MSGLTLFSLETSETFERSFKKLVKSFKSSSQQQDFKELTAQLLKELIINPYPPKARAEPLPMGLKLVKNWGFNKLPIVIGKGASGQVRLMYLVNEIERIIKLLWIYNHDQFNKRPPDKHLQEAIKDLLKD